MNTCLLLSVSTTTTGPQPKVFHDVPSPLREILVEQAMQFQQTALAARRLRTSMHTLEAALGEAQQALTALHQGGRRGLNKRTPTTPARE